MFMREQTGMKQNKILTIGLMGNSGVGKSTVSDYLKEKSAFIIDADKISHSLMEKGKKCYNEVTKEFGEEILNEDKTINRQKLGAIVFNDKAKLKRLNEISHKIIVDEILRQKAEIIANPKEYKYIVIDAPLLTETGLDKACDTVWLVYADYEERIKRIIKRDNISRQRAEERFKNQTPFEVLKDFANEVLDNTDEDKTKLYSKIDKILREF